MTPRPPVAGRGLTILMTADTVGGVWTYALGLARALGEDGGATVHLATMGAPLSPSQWDEARAVANVRIHESHFKLEWMPNPWDDLARAGDWLLDLEAQLRPDIIHLNGYAHAVCPFASPVLVVAHSCVCSWWRFVKNEAAPPEWDRYRAVVRDGLCAARAVAAPTGAIRDALHAEYGALPRPVHVIPNARAHTDGFRPAQTGKEPFIFAAGRAWDEAKNIAALVRVAPRLQWPVVVAGDAEEPTTLTPQPASLPRTLTPQPPSSPCARPLSQAKEGESELPYAASGSPSFACERGLAQGEEGGRGVRVEAANASPCSSPQFTGKLSAADVAGYMARAAIYALPARYEPFGLSALEAALSGCALVLGDIPTLREVWGDAAIFVAPDDDAALHAALARLIEDTRYREEMASRALARAQIFSPVAMATAYAAVYADLLAAQAP